MNSPSETGDSKGARSEVSTIPRQVRRTPRAIEQGLSPRLAAEPSFAFAEEDCAEPAPSGNAVKNLMLRRGSFDLLLPPSRADDPAVHGRRQVLEHRLDLAGEPVRVRQPVAEGKLGPHRTSSPGGWKMTSSAKRESNYLCSI